MSGVEIASDSARAEGRAAFACGIARADNPYTANAADLWAWDQGWLIAQLEAAHALALEADPAVG